MMFNSPNFKTKNINQISNTSDITDHSSSNSFDNSLWTPSRRKPIEDMNKENLFLLCERLRWQYHQVN